jgi:DNA-binding beta-propeller fold protein YncE
MRVPARSGLLAALGVCFTVALFVAPAGAEVVYQRSFAEPGDGPGQLSQPTGIAVNEATGDVYVADRNNHRIEQFDSNGSFVRMWGKGVNQDTGGDICPVNPGDVCQAGMVGEEAGQFNFPQGIGVDNSNGPAAGSVYVLDAGNIRVQRFTASGQFVLMWGKAVDAQTAANLCTTEHTCRAGLSSGSANSKEVTEETEEGLFKGWLGGSAPDQRPALAVGTDGSVYVTDGQAFPEPRIQKFAPSGAYLGKVGAPFEDAGSLALQDFPTVSPAGDVYVRNAYFGEHTAFVQFAPSDFVPGGEAPYRHTYGAQQDLSSAAVDPSNEYLIALSGDCEAVPGLPGTHITEFHPSGQEVDCTIPASPSVSLGSSMLVTDNHELYVSDPLANRIRVFTTPVAGPPEVSNEKATEIAAKSAMINLTATANLDDTTYHIEYGTSPCSIVPNPCQATPESTSLGASYQPRSASRRLDDLAPATTYYYRVVVTNGVDSDVGADHSFRTFALPTFTPCPNNLARQQTGATFLFDCRAYELVSASNQGGYDVASDLVPGQSPFGGYPNADSRALYSVHNGGIPNAGKPTNRGPDPYLAVRDETHQRWDTEYVGVPADAPSSQPFSSTLAGADGGLGSFAFSGPEICNPCFNDGSAGIPVRLADGTLVQGMVGAPGFAVSSPEPAAEVKKPLSADGTHFVFGSKQQFASGGNDDGVNASLYDRNLSNGFTQAVSVTPGAAAIEDGTDIAALDISGDGKRILVGELVSTDAAGNRYWHLYMHVGTEVTSIDVTPGAVAGVLYDGMTSDGTKVYFTAKDALTTETDQDTDTSADIYRADVSAEEAALTRVSIAPGQSPGGIGDTDSCVPAANSARTYWNSVGPAPSCDAVAIGGGGGVAPGNGTIYFLSPEKLDGTLGVQGAPNLYTERPGQAPRFVATLESSANAPLKPKAHLFEGSFGHFSYPEGVAMDHTTGKYYVLDTFATSGPEFNEKGELIGYKPGAYVQRFEPSGEPDLTFGANSKLSSSPFGPFLESGSGITPKIKTGAATQLAVDNSGGTSKGALYVPDFNNRFVAKFKSTGSFVTKVSTGGFIGQPPSGVAVNPANGRIALTSPSNEQVYTFDANGNPIAPGPFSVEVPPSPDFTQPQPQPLGLSIDPATGSFYVVNGRETRLYNSAGVFVKVFDPNPSLGVAVDPSDSHVYVDEGKRVIEFDPSGVQVGASIGAGLLEKSVSLAADSGKLIVSNPGRGTVVSFSPPRIPPDSGYDSPLVIDSLSEAETRQTSDFQLNSNGDQAAFPSAMPLTSFENDGHYEIFHFDATAPGGLDCASCSPTQAVPETDAALASDGLSITEDGRVFFNTAEALVLRDSNFKMDAYEWKEGGVELISSGHDPLDSGLLSVSADGTDAYFFTRDTLAVGDENGTLMKLYDARVNGGFFLVPEPPECVASDECHGAGSPTPPQPVIGSASPGKGGQEVGCKKAFVKKQGKCVRKHPRRHVKRRGQRHRRANRG